MSPKLNVGQPLSPGDVEGLETLFAACPPAAAPLGPGPG
jgi:hypothetical protein